MSFLDDILDVGSSVWGWATGGSTSAGLARAAALAYMLRELTNSMNKSDDTKTNPGTGTNKPNSTSTNSTISYSREQVDPNTENSIPVVYGQAYISGSVIDAVMVDNNQVMFYAIALCEKTGYLLSTRDPVTELAEDSLIRINEIYWNDLQMVFRYDSPMDTHLGHMAQRLVNQDGVSSNDIEGLVNIWLFNNGSNSPVPLFGYPFYDQRPAYQIFPNWTPNHTMDGLVFAIVSVKYSAVKNITGLGTLRFKITNTLKKPGDVMFDYMTNTRYGAGINAQEVYDI